jgi:hypothetical protein
MDLAAVVLSPPEATGDFTVETWDGTEPEALFGGVHDLCCRAFANNAFFTPIGREEFVAMYMPFVPLMSKELIFFARDPAGALAGLLFGMPNHAEAPAPKSAILKTYASLIPGAGRHLAHAFHTAAKRMGFQKAIHALIHDDNLSAERSDHYGAEIFRRYALMGRRLDA